MDRPPKAGIDAHMRIAADAYLAAVVESSDDAIISKDLTGVVQSCNAAGERLFGYRADELVGQSIRILIPPERQREEDEILSRIGRGERIEHFETVRVRKDGRRIDVSLTVSPVRDASGAIIGISKIARDITEQKQITAALAAQHEWFRVTLNSIADAVIATDLHGHIVFMNGQAERLTGWRAGDAAGRPTHQVFRVVHERTGQAVVNPVRRVLSEEAGPERLRLVALDGTEIPIEESGAPIRDQNRDVIGLVLVFRDITERRRVDQERIDSAAERDRLLEAERAARSEAERASRVKDDFVAVVSHELRTPLNAILGWAEILTQEPLEPALRERGLEIITRNTRVQAQLVADLLDVSRIATGKLRLEIQAVDLQSILTTAVDTVQPEAAAKRIRIICEFANDIGPIAGDPARLQQAVWNLLSNAIKFTPENGRVDLALRCDGPDARITVVDTGAGIRPEVLPHVFDRFHQADLSITRRFGGLGLGLAIVKHIVELHDGRVLAESAGEHQGATFSIWLPMSPPPRTAPSRSQQRRIRADANIEGVRVLVVEDEPDTREFLVRFLLHHGAIVFAAGSALEAMPLFLAVQPDVLISDIGLPDVDGYELLRQIRQTPRGAAVPAIALTAYARPEDRSRAYAAGFQTHLAKPLNVADLLGRIVEIIS